MIMGKKIAIVGTGAVGGYAGAYMAQAGEDVTFIDFWPENVEKMRADGLKISHIRDVPEFTVPVNAIHITELQETAKSDPFDIAFVCVKSYDTAWATIMIQQYLSPNGYIVSLQNCINEETIAGIVGWGRVLGALPVRSQSIFANRAMCDAPRARVPPTTPSSASVKFTVGSQSERRKSASWWPMPILLTRLRIYGANVGPN